MNRSAASDEIAMFVRVVDLGTFAAAAEGTGLTPSGVSRAVTRLEDRLGVKLLQRTTRRLAMTSEGEILLHKGRQILAAIDEAEAEVTAGRGRPQGLLRINTGTAFAKHRLVSILVEFCSRYPEITVDLSVADNRIDVIGEKIDVAIRTGPPSAETLATRTIGEARRMIVASPDYLRRNGVPQTPADLAHHTIIGIPGASQLLSWPFRVDGRVQSVAVNLNVMCDSAVILIDGAIAGLGIVRLASFMMDEAIAAGKLVPILEDIHVSEPFPITAVMPPGRQHLPRVRAFLDFLSEQS